MSVFDAVEVLAEFSKAIRHRPDRIWRACSDSDGVDPGKVSALTDSVRHVHAETADYLASVIGSSALQQRKKAAVSD